MWGRREGPGVAGGLVWGGGGWGGVCEGGVPAAGGKFGELEL